MTTTASAPAAVTSGVRGGPWATLVAIAFGVIMVALDGTIVAVANPAIGADLQTSLAELQWVTHGYLLGLAVFLITAGKLGDRFGYRRMYMVGIIGFVVVSVAIALSSGVVALVAFRIAQGVFGAIISPAAMGLLRAAFPPHRLSQAFGVFGGMLGAASAGGPIIGGMLVSSFGWQSVFYINVPVGVVAVLLGVWLLAPNRAADPGSRFDLVGVGLLSVAMFALVWALVEAPVVGWTAPVTLGSAAVALAVGTLFVLWERRVVDPLLPLGIFRSASVSIGVVLMILVALGLIGSLFFITFYLQGVHGYSPLVAGMVTLPMSITMAIGSPLGGRIIDRVGTRVPVAVGLLAAALALFGLSLLRPDSGVAFMGIWFVLLGGGLSVVMTGATAAIIGNAPVRYAGVASGVQQSAMQLGGSLGTAALGAVLSAAIVSSLPRHFAAAGLPEIGAEEATAMASVVSQGGAAVPEGAAPDVAAAITQASHLAFMDGMHLAFGIASVVMVAAALLSLLMKPAPRGGEAVVHI
ncbi:MFS transporter [Marinitenerispora sediminis]|uniref:MFS transporter n=1 Tax=Marinitenerispora sediminis TaxID=1931232 RepID=A0A368T8S3_9ACTN|nr:MFS transporter [Marinitenerispora sediminis]RCV53528.1 MFS transporter [Marinitenerispora sediminis]RCV57684.1 MFS transporter [Marinitenerispora sediminis]RCV60759.1 MFS transporter [Marinitenerispora sediminis]